jgi:hypothetical protein
VILWDVSANERDEYSMDEVSPAHSHDSRDSKLRISANTVIFAMIGIGGLMALAAMVIGLTAIAH